MRIPRALFDEMLAHAVADSPDECCGFLAVDGDDAVRVVPTENTAHTPLRFEMSSRELFDAVQGIEDDGFEVGAIYHSHTRTEPYPSQTDVNFAAGWPGVAWLIFGTAGEAPTARIFEILDGVVSEQPLRVE